MSDFHVDLDSGGGKRGKYEKKKKKVLPQPSLNMVSSCHSQMPSPLHATQASNQSISVFLARMCLVFFDRGKLVSFISTSR